MNSIRVQLGERSYDIAVTSGEAAGVGPFARQRAKGSRAFVVADEHVIAHADAVAASLRDAGFEPLIVSLPSGEAQKALTVASYLYDNLAEARADRQTLVVPVGGGVIGDLAGFIAATWNRGLPLLMVPTTLLAMVDSSVGGKVGINHPRGKNLIGAFHQPVGVWIDTTFLSTLPDREYRSGLAEVVKYGVILDAEFFAYLEQRAAAILARDGECIRYIVARSCRLKADVVERDEREETGLRAALNYGHTFAHAFETVGGYGAWLHGEAVSAGMVCASRLAERRGLIGSDITERQRRLLQTFGLPIAPQRWPVDELLVTMRGDKKAVAGRLRFVLPRRLGAVAMFEDVPESDVRAVLETISSEDRIALMALSVSDNVRDLLTLSLVPGIGPRLTAALLERFGSAAAALRASADQLCEVPYISPRLAELLTQALTRSDATAELERIDRHGVRLIALGTPDYPPALANIPDPPYLLYIRGALTEADIKAVALVGSRQCTDYGRRVAARLATGLVRAGVTVISGLARGIDGAAHRAALQAGGRTLAVLAGGLSRIYPPEHADLAREVEASGAVLTEACMEREPQPGMFPVRNRIISGLSKVVVLIEAAVKSGALITASHAADQGRTVMAVPGSVDADSSGGTHELIRKGAVLCRSVEDVLEELHGVSAMAVTEKHAASAPAAPPAPSGPPPGLDDNQRRIWDMLTQPCHLDQMVQRLGLTVPQVSGALMMLEMRKVVRRLPGNRYERC